MSLLNYKIPLLFFVFIISLLSCSPSYANVKNETDLNHLALAPLTNETGTSRVFQDKVVYVTNSGKVYEGQGKTWKPIDLPVVAGMKSATLGDHHILSPYPMVKHRAINMGGYHTLTDFYFTIDNWQTTVTFPKESLIPSINGNNVFISNARISVDDMGGWEISLGISTNGSTSYRAYRYYPDRSGAAAFLESSSASATAILSVREGDIPGTRRLGLLNSGSNTMYILSRDRRNYHTIGDVTSFSGSDNWIHTVGAGGNQRVYFFETDGQPVDLTPSIQSQVGGTQLIKDIGKMSFSMGNQYYGTYRQNYQSSAHTLILNSNGTATSVKIKPVGDATDGGKEALGLPNDVGNIGGGMTYGSFLVLRKASCSCVQLYKINLDNLTADLSLLDNLPDFGAGVMQVNIGNKIYISLYKSPVVYNNLEAMTILIDQGLPEQEQASILKVPTVDGSSNNLFNVLMPYSNRYWVFGFGNHPSSIKHYDSKNDSVIYSGNQCSDGQGPTNAGISTCALTGNRFLAIPYDSSDPYTLTAQAPNGGSLRLDSYDGYLIAINHKDGVNNYSLPEISGSDRAFGEYSRLSLNALGVSGTSVSFPYPEGLQSVNLSRYGFDTISSATLFASYSGKTAAIRVSGKNASGEDYTNFIPLNRIIDPPAANPPATNPPAANPPATNPPATNPPATNPPATNPPATNPPATNPPATNPPQVVKIAKPGVVVISALQKRKIINKSGIRMNVRPAILKTKYSFVVTISAAHARRLGMKVNKGQKRVVIGRGALIANKKSHVLNIKLNSTAKRGFARTKFVVNFQVALTVTKSGYKSSKIVRNGKIS